MRWCIGRRTETKGGLLWFSEVFLPLHQRARDIILGVAQVAVGCGVSYRAQCPLTTEGDDTRCWDWWQRHPVNGRMLLAFNIVPWERCDEEREAMYQALDRAQADLKAVLKSLHASPRPSGDEMQAMGQEFESCLLMYVTSFRYGMRYLKGLSAARGSQREPGIPVQLGWLGGSALAADRMSQCADDLRRRIESSQSYVHEERPRV